MQKTFENSGKKQAHLKIFSIQKLLNLTTVTVTYITYIPTCLQITYKLINYTCLSCYKWCRFVVGDFDWLHLVQGLRK